ncbi:MAG TPA: iron uptake system protein EfeO [Stackebrandtia sp.]|jgi:iron uptake system component EfeO|uniref:iron uptake system protein EfeO n=1 Tax=Stackebrandtia sp. TaxID=2023065 RepID=UPI002D5029C4|nr:iron uptake system protein EfeO [Stackebrandtia sp.]HZE37884.1 iron uptake system protein EfeO [Stackebrandtia sp.]
MRKPVLVGTAALAILAMAACTEKPGDTASGGPIAVKATDDSCEVSATKTKAGTVTFKVSNKGTKVTEFYVYGKGDRVMSEVENITPGLTRKLIVELPAGKYQTACKPGMVGDGIRGKFTVTGKSEKLDADANVKQAVKDYEKYVSQQADSLVTKTKEFTDAVKAKKIDKAKELFPVARTYWERIEPVAEKFGDLDPKLDGRADDHPKREKDPQFTGFHRLEYDLWKKKDLSDSAKYAKQLNDGVQEVAKRAKSEKVAPLDLANGAKGLLDEVATMKITGEEDRYSHTDLWDFAANLEGSQAAIAALRPVIDDRDPKLGKQLDDLFSKAKKELAKYAEGDGYRGWDKLSKDDLKKLSDAINALGEPVSKVAGLVSKGK